MKAKFCDECKHYKKELDGVSTVCNLEHKPRFYVPKTLADALNNNFGWMRVCTDFVYEQQYGSKA